jgi:ATP-binding cassette, subfamily B, bacterial IrtB/YbtQ
VTSPTGSERALGQLHRLPFGSLLSSLLQIFGAVGLPTFVLLGLLMVDPPMAAAVAASIAVAVPLFRWTNRVFKSMAVERADLLADVGTWMVEYVQGIGVVRALDRGGARLGYFRDAVGEIKRINDALAVSWSCSRSRAMGVVQLGASLVVTPSADTMHIWRSVR